MRKRGGSRKLPFDQRLENVLRGFWNQVDKRGPDECWGWNGQIVRSSCPQMRYGNLGVWTGSKSRNYRAHRFSWMLMNGPIPDGMMVLHRCDNSNCVNPNHLFLGTAKTNADDCKAKGRSWFGRRNGRAKLTEEAVRDIRTSSERISVLAKRYGVHWTTAAKARDGVFWPHVK